MADDTKIGPDGTLYERNGWSGQYEPQQGWGGPEKDQGLFGHPNIERDGFGRDQRATDGWGRPIDSKDGTPLYERSGGGGGGGGGGGSSAGSDLAGGIVFFLIIAVFWLAWQILKILWRLIVGIHRGLYHRYGNRAWWYELVGYSIIVLTIAGTFGLYTLWINVRGYSGSFVPTPVGAGMPTASVVAPTFAPVTPTLIARPTATPSVPTGSVSATTLILRDGPDTSYSIVDRLPQGTAVTILARSASSEWYQITVPSRSKQGWVAARYIDTRVALDSIPIASSTPPTRAIPANTATPLSPAGVRINYYAEQETLARGACTVLHWGIENIQALYLNGEGVQGWDEKRVCPSTTTTYTMRIVLHDGRAVERNIVIRVQ